LKYRHINFRLRGREVSAGMRVVVLYEQAEDMKIAKVEYHGTVTRVSSALGKRVWFDAHMHTEQEWVNDADEWRFEHEKAPVIAGAPAERDGEDEASEDEEAKCEYWKIKLKLGKLNQMLPGPGAGGAGVERVEHDAAAGLEHDRFDTGCGGERPVLAFGVEDVGAPSELESSPNEGLDQ
jgi:hypothetical protein